MVGANAPERANWEVIWVKDNKVQRKDCGHDLVEALRVRDLVKEAGRKNVTLRCKNFGFGPPEELRPQIVKVKIPMDPPRIVKKNGKRYRKTWGYKEMRKIPLKQLNAEGIWWCPYCMKLRRFKKTNSFVIDGIRVQETRHVCPLCGISHRDPHVRRWNPIATRLFYELEEAPRRRASRTKESRRKNFKRKRRRTRE